MQTQTRITTEPPRVGFDSQPRNSHRLSRPPTTHRGVPRSGVASLPPSTPEPYGVASAHDAAPVHMPRSLRPSQRLQPDLSLLGRSHRLASATGKTSAEWGESSGSPSREDDRSLGEQQPANLWAIGRENGNSDRTQKPPNQGFKFSPHTDQLPPAYISPSTSQQFRPSGATTIMNNAGSPMMSPLPSAQPGSETALEMYQKYQRGLIMRDHWQDYQLQLKLIHEHHRARLRRDRYDHVGQTDEAQATSDVLSPRRPTLKEVLNNTASPPYTLAAYTAFLSEQHCLEMLQFVTEARDYVDACKEYADHVDAGYFDLLKRWKRIMNVYVRPGAPREIDISAEYRVYLTEWPAEASDSPPPSVVLEQALKRTYGLMMDSTYIPFCKSLEMSASSASLTTPELTPMTATRESSLTPASMIFSEPMTRSNTDDVICTGIDMVRLSSVSKPEAGFGKDVDDSVSRSSTQAQHPVDRLSKYPSTTMCKNVMIYGHCRFQVEGRKSKSLHHLRD
jgi:hypothetical protein